MNIILTWILGILTLLSLLIVFEVPYYSSKLYEKLKLYKKVKRN